MSYPLRIPCNSADSFAADVIQSQTLLLRFDIPDGHETSAATSDQNMCDLPIPIQAFNIICAGRIVSQSEGVVNIIQVGNEELAFSTTGG